CRPTQSHHCGPKLLCNSVRTDLQSGSAIHQSAWPGDAMPGSSSGSVTHWIGLLKAGDAAAAQKLWESYFRRLVALARKKLQGLPRRAADEEDVALSAFQSFCCNAEQGRFPQLFDRDGLWQLLVVITTRKAAHLRRAEGRQKRGGDQVRVDGARQP